MWPTIRTAIYEVASWLILMHAYNGELVHGRAVGAEIEARLVESEMEFPSVSNPSLDMVVMGR